MLDTADAGAVKARFRTHLDKLLAKLTKKSGAAQTPGGKCAKEKRLTGALATQIRAIQKAVNRTAGKQIDADLATSLALRLGEAATSADQVRAALAC
jgi:DNA-binding FrmR family transcriptional regulator